jgi:hypothetical protein
LRPLRFQKSISFPLFLHYLTEFLNQTLYRRVFLAIDSEQLQKPSERLANEDTHRQLLARSRYLLFKSKTNWTVRQIGQTH